MTSLPVLVSEAFSAPLSWVTLHRIPGEARCIPLVLCLGKRPQANVARGTGSAKNLKNQLKEMLKAVVHTDRCHWGSNCSWSCHTAHRAKWSLKGPSSHHTFPRLVGCVLGNLSLIRKQEFNKSDLHECLILLRFPSTHPTWSHYPLPESS